MTFNTLGLKPELVQAVETSGYTKATPIQLQAIPAILDGKDVLGGAQTGTGKTAAFALPILDKLSNAEAKIQHPRALIITPTRELADQVCESFKTYGQYLKLRIAKIFGGVKINPQISQLRQGTDIVISTPGRLMDHMQQKTINLRHVEVLVLDEADRMLDMGFIRDIKRIVSALPKQRQNLMFSATFSDEIKGLANNILRFPVYVEVSKRNAAADKVEQIAYYIAKEQKRYLLAHLIKEETWFQVLVFVRTKRGANNLASRLQKEGIISMAIHGNKSQGARTRALEQFKKGDVQALIATDIAARGLHLEDLSHVVNYDLPQVPEDYIHRIGRTGRAGKSGIAVSIICPEDTKQLQQIQRLMKKAIPEAKSETFVPAKIEAQKSVSHAHQAHPRGSGGGHYSRKPNTSREGGASRRPGSWGGNGSSKNSGKPSGNVKGAVKNTRIVKIRKAK